MLLKERSHLMPVSQAAFMPDEVAYPIQGSGRGSLNGLTVAVKDVFDVQGTRTSGGSPAWRDSRPSATRNAGAVTRLLRDGADVIGKTICDEFCYSTVGVNFHFGTPLNANAPERIPGGSSSGSASAVASGVCDIAIGSDTGGSVRVPAALCGIYGIRVSRGRFDLAGSMKMAPSFDAGGWFSSSPEALRMAGLSLLVGAPSQAEVGQIIALKDAFDIADNKVARSLFETLERKSVGLEPAHWLNASEEGLECWREAMRIVQAFEVWETFGPFLETHRPALGPGVDERMKIAAEVSSLDVAEAREMLQSVSQRMEELTPVGTVLALPTVPTTAPFLNASPETLEDYRVRGMRLSSIASISGLPQVTIPAGAVDGAPIGLSLIGWRGGDEALLNLAASSGPHINGTAAR